MNSCPPGTAFLQFYATGTALQTTTFIDQHGRFAKRWEEVATVAVVFVDGTAFDLTRDEYAALPLGIREVMQATQSGTVPNPGASNA